MVGFLLTQAIARLASKESASWPRDSPAPLPKLSALPPSPPSAPRRSAASLTPSPLLALRPALPVRVAPLARSLSRFLVVALCGSVRGGFGVVRVRVSLSPPLPCSAREVLAGKTDQNPRAPRRAQPRTAGTAPDPGRAGRLSAGSRRRVERHRRRGGQGAGLGGLGGGEAI